MTYTAVVLAGSRPGRDALSERFGTDLKALIPVYGEPMVGRPVRALLESDYVGSIIVLSQESERLRGALADDPKLRVAWSDGTIAATMLSLCNDPSTQWPLLVTTADSAMLDGPTVNEFCAGAEGADLAVGVVERGTLMRRFPDAKRTWLSFRGGAYTGANLFMLGSPAVAPVIELWRAVEQDRKKGWRIVSMLGPAVLIGAALRLLSIDDVLAIVARRFGLKVKAVRLSNPLAGIDVDKVEDHALVEAILRERA